MLGLTCFIYSPPILSPPKLFQSTFMDISLCISKIWTPIKDNHIVTLTTQFLHVTKYAHFNCLKLSPDKIHTFWLVISLKSFLIYRLPSISLLFCFLEFYLRNWIICLCWIGASSACLLSPLDTLWLAIASSLSGRVRYSRFILHILPQIWNKPFFQSTLVPFKDNGYLKAVSVTRDAHF